MADLTFKVDGIPQMKSAALVKISGAIDAKTVIHFQDKLDQLQQEKYTHFILDMEGIKYVNSTGLGTLVNVADALETRGGGIALIKIHPKVKVVFDMLGLNAFFKIFSNEEEALNYFRESGTLPPAETEVSTPAPPPPPSQPQEPAAPPPPAKPASSVLSTKVTPPSQPGAPYSLVCAVCKVKLNIPRPGSFKCPRCATFFKLYEDGTVNFSERKKASPLQMKLSSTDECIEGLNEFVRVLSQRLGFGPQDVQGIRDAVSEICNAIVEKAYNNKQYLSYNVVITPSSSELKLQISDYGQFIYEESYFQRSRQIMDEFEHKQHPKGGNIINMSKRIQ